jgi:outer membrane biogenesis lipoprotein LolB
MKKQIIRMITLLAFSSVLLTSCSVEYRQRHAHRDGRNDRDHHDDHHDDHHYNRY